MQMATAHHCAPSFASSLAPQWSISIGGLPPRSATRNVHHEKRIAQPMHMAKNGKYYVSSLIEACTTCASGKTSIKNRTAHPESHDHAQRQPPLQPRNEELRDSESCCGPDRLRLNPLESVFGRRSIWPEFDPKPENNQQQPKTPSPFSRARWQNRSPRKRTNQK